MVIEFIIQHLSAILAAHKQGGTSKAAWVILTGALPEIQNVMSFATFRQYSVLIVALSKSGNLGSVKCELLNNDEELDSVKQEVNRLQELRHSVKQSKVKQLKPKQGLTIAGWSIQHSGGYYRGFRRVDGKIEGVHLGKNLDNAESRIAAKEAKLHS